MLVAWLSTDDSRKAQWAVGWSGRPVFALTRALDVGKSLSEIVVEFDLLGHFGAEIEVFLLLASNYACFINVCDRSPP